MHFCIVSYLKSIPRLSLADNLGGIIDIQVARKADIESIPEAVLGVVYGDIVFKPEKGFVSWAGTSETASLKGDARRTREGSTKKNSLPFLIAKSRADISAMLTMAEDDELIIVFKDANGKTKIFGTLESPVQFEYGHTTGGAHADLNHYACNFFYDGPENMFEYNGDVPASPAGAAPVIVTVNGEAVAIGYPGDTIAFTTDFDFDFQIIGT